MDLPKLSGCTGLAFRPSVVFCLLHLCPIPSFPALVRSWFVLTTFAIAIPAFGADRLAGGPARVIIDTDMANDCDDVGALAVLHALADLGEAELVAVVVNIGEELGCSAAAVDAVNTYYGRPNIPIGVWKPQASVTRKRSAFAAALRHEFPHDAVNDAAIPDAIVMLRQTLASAPDASFVYCSLGALSNMAALVASSADAISPLDGREMVSRKIRHTVIMAGAIIDLPQPETNLRLDPAAAITVPENWPTPILWSPFEVGKAIITGAELQSMPATNPVRRAYELRPFQGGAALDRGKPSHDQAAVLLAVRGPEPTLWEIAARGRVEITPELRCKWHPNPDGRHRRVGIKDSPDRLVAIIGDLMTRPPRRFTGP